MSTSNSTVSKIVAKGAIELAREGATRFDFWYSFSGGIVAQGALVELELHLDGVRIIVSSPFRLGHGSRRANPQLNPENVAQAFKGYDGSLPLQISGSPCISEDGLAAISVWSGLSESDKHPASKPILPMDSLRVCVFAPEGGALQDKISRYVVVPLLEGVRNVTGQWWAGRSYENVSGLLHFVVPLSEENGLIGKPAAVCRTLTANADFVPLTDDLWKCAAEHIGFRRVDPVRAISLDAIHQFASDDRRTALILACSAVEVARDIFLESRAVKLSKLRTSTTDLLKHLSAGFENVFGRNFKSEDEAAYSDLEALWIARGDAAHGKDVKWRVKGRNPIELWDLEATQFIGAMNGALNWLNSVGIK